MTRVAQEHELSSDPAGLSADPRTAITRTARRRRTEASGDQFITAGGHQALAEAREQRDAWPALRLADLTPAQRRVMAEASRLPRRMSRQ